MLIRYPYTQGYVFGALESAPVLLSRALTGLTADEADFRPDPARFTIREAVAHLADWETVFLGRLRRVVTEDEPELPGHDEGQWAIEHNYAALDPAEQQDLFAERRAETVAFLRARGSTDWERGGIRREMGGRLSLADFATLITLHDTYHLRQVSDWRARWADQA